MGLKKIQIGNDIVSEDGAAYLIAEIGINHNGDIQIAKKLMDAAFATGWNAVKFQKRVPEICVPEHQKGVMKETPWGTMTYLDYKKHIEFGKEEYDYIDRYCKEKPLVWSASPWDMPSLEFLLEYDIPFLKMASATITNRELMEKAAKSGKTMVVSTGMSEWEEIDNAVDILEKYSKGNFVLLHTNSNYPAPRADLNLKMMDNLRKRYDCLVGYSGHEEGVEPSVLAACMGACMIERHVTLSHDLWGTDQKSSLTVHAMSMLHDRIQAIPEVRGTGERVLTEGELKMRAKLRG
jgi:N-acetylneuraminate synthase